MATSLPLQHAHRSSGLSILIAILLILAGLAAICLPFLAGVAVSIAVGWLLLIAGIMHLVFGWHTRSAGAVIWKLLVGLAYLFAAFYILDHPGRGLLTLHPGTGVLPVLRGDLRGGDLRAASPVSGQRVVSVRRDRHDYSRHHDFHVVAGELGMGSGTLIGISILFSGISRLSYSLMARRLTASPAI